MQILGVLALLRPEIDGLVMALEQVEDLAVMLRRRPVIGDGEDRVARLARRDLPAALAVQHPHGRTGGVDDVGDHFLQMLVGVQVAHRVKEGRRQDRAKEKAGREIRGPTILLPTDAEQHDVSPGKIVERGDAPIGSHQHVRFQDVGAADDRQGGAAVGAHLGQAGPAMGRGAHIFGFGKQRTDRLPHRVHDEMIA